MHHAGDVLRHCAANRPSLYRSGSGCWCVVDISEPEAQQAVTAMEFMPVTDPLPGAPQQPQQRLVPPRAGLAHQPLRQRRVDRPGQSTLTSKTQLASPAPTGRVPARAAMRPHPAAACRHRVHLPAPPARPGPGVALDEEGEERREHAQPVVDRPRRRRHRERTVHRSRLACRAGRDHPGHTATPPPDRERRTHMQAPALPTRLHIAPSTHHVSRPVNDSLSGLCATRRQDANDPDIANRVAGYWHHVVPGLPSS